jgi:translation initiation factor 5
MSGKMINIPSYVKDPNYRYKMPKMDLRQESRLNGVKTNVENLEDIAKALRVPGEAIIKFLCYELGVSKEKKTIIKGQHTYEMLLKFLDKFIEKYIIC